MCMYGCAVRGEVHTTMHRGACGGMVDLLLTIEVPGYIKCQLVLVEVSIRPLGIVASTLDLNSKIRGVLIIHTTSNVVAHLLARARV